MTDLCAFWLESYSVGPFLYQTLCGHTSTGAVQVSDAKDKIHNLLKMLHYTSQLSTRKYLPHLQTPNSLCASSSFTLHVQQRFLFFCTGLSDCVATEIASLILSSGWLDVDGMSSLVTAAMLILGIPTGLLVSTFSSDGWLSFWNSKIHM